MVCDRGMQHAAQKNLSLAEQQNLLLQTLPLDYQHVGAFIEDADKVDIQQFKRKLIELIMGTNWDQSSSILKASRRTGEKILSYFLRLSGMYSFCTGKTDAEIQNDQWFSMMLYQKIIETLPLGAKAEFQRDCEMSMENGLLKFQDLKKKIITIARKAPIFEKQQLSNQVIHVLEGQNSMDRSETRQDVRMVPSINSSQDTKKPQNKHKREENRACYYCGKVGHIVKNCWKKANDLKKKQQSHSYKREPTTDGRRNQRSNR